MDEKTVPVVELSDEQVLAHFALMLLGPGGRDQVLPKLVAKLSEAPMALFVPLARVLWELLDRDQTLRRRCFVAIADALWTPEVTRIEPMLRALVPVWRQVIASFPPSPTAA
jgi:hypothetical protein